MASSDSQMDKAQRGCHPRSQGLFPTPPPPWERGCVGAELPGVNINTGALAENF